MAQAKKTAKKAPAKKAAAKKTTSSDESNAPSRGTEPENAASGTPVRNPANVRPQQYDDGTGFKAGQRAPKAKYIDPAGKVSDKEPAEGGWQLVAEGAVVTQAQADQIAGK